MIRNCIIISSLLLLFVSAKAQQNILFSGSFDNATAEAFFTSIEKATPFYFYYDNKQLDSVRITLNVKDLPVEEVLRKAFAGTDVNFSIDNDHKVYVSRKIKILTQLPADYFSGKADVAPSDLSNALINNNVNKKAKKVTASIKSYVIGSKSMAVKQGNVIVTGNLVNERTGEPVLNASIYVEELNMGTMADQYGYYRLAIPPGKYHINVQSIGMKPITYELTVYNEGKLDVALSEEVAMLKEVVVSAQKRDNISRVQLGVERLNINTIRRVPTVFGEADILRVMLTLPGVKTVGEAGTGFNVRGGSTDQNLVLMNGTTVYNPSHFFGMFSAFNPEFVKDIELYKSSIPAKFGGRLSSVLDISLREGNKKQLSGSAGIGVVTSRFNIEGPLVKDKTSFMVGGRSTYANWLLKLLPSPYSKSKAAFNDGNLTVSHKINDKNDIYLTGYFSNDNFNLSSDTTYGYSNRNAGVNWKHNFNSKLLAFFSAGYDMYRYNVYSERNAVNAYTLGFDIQQVNFKTDFSYLVNSSHALDFGLSTIKFSLSPGSFLPRGSESLVKEDIVEKENALESAVYLSDKFTLSDRFTIIGGVRYSLFNYLGPGTINYYPTGIPRDISNVISTKSYTAGQLINSYHGPEWRASLRYAFSESFSVKAGYNSLRQYIHMLSNTSAIAPTDIWKLSDPNIKPQVGDQVSLGFYKNFKSNVIETSLEVYYKKIQDYLDYKAGAVLVMNHHVETDVVNTKGKAYGVELSLKKITGKLNGWISYSYSRTLLQMNDSTMGTPVNEGNWYPANYDKPHDATVVANFKVNHIFSLSLNLTYSTGRPITLPVGRFFYAGSQRVLYSDRNSYRTPDYFRTDFSMNIDGNHKVKQKTHNSWTIGVYNLTGRRNPFSVYYTSENGVVKGYKLSIFGSAIPFINFNIKF